MRPAGRGPLDSLYFEYPAFPVPHLDAGAIAKRQRVVIVGAGPVGMTAALVLAQYGVESLLLDNKSTFNDGSRAICIARQSFHILEKIGVVAPFLGKALGWRHGTSFYRGEPIFRLTMPHPENEKYLPMYNIEQQFTEQYLWQEIEKNPLIETRWHSEVRAVVQDDRTVKISVVDPERQYEVVSDYVLAADGARSAIRAAMNLRLKGKNFEGRYIIADVKMAHDYPTERRALFSPKSNPGGTILIHKQPDDIWRIDYKLPDGQTEKEALEEGELRARIQEILGDIGYEGSWELEWWSIYSANTLCLDDYKHGRVLFIGDSGHIVPIFGVRGLNNGLADAQNAGWKLAYVLKGLADERLLDSYTPERRGATLDVFENATKSARFMTPPTRGWALAREAALSLAQANEFTREFANPRQMVPYTYAHSPLTPFAHRDSEFEAGPASGAACINARLGDGGYLLENTGKGFCLLGFAERAQPSAFEALAEQCRALDPDLTAIPNCSKNTHSSDASDDVRSLFGATSDTIYLLRPDGHVAGRWRTAEPAEILHTLRVCLGRA